MQMESSTSISAANTMDAMGDMQMSMMSLNWNSHCVVFLFQVLHAKTQFEFVVGCLITIAVCAFVQLLHLSCAKQFIVGADPYAPKDKSRRTLQLVTYFQNNQESDRNKFSEQQGEKKILMHNQEQNKIKLFSKLRYLTYHVVLSLINLLIMLLAMTMNCYIILSICVGVSLGKLLNEQIKIMGTKSNSKKQDQTPKQDLKEVQNYCEL